MSLPWPYPDVDELNRAAAQRRGRQLQRQDRTQAKGFLDGIPKGVWFLAGFVGSGVLSKGHGRKR